MSGIGLTGIAGIGLALLLVWAVVVGGRAWSRRGRIRKRMQPLVELLTAEASETVTARVQERRTQGESALLARLNARYPLAGGARTTSIAGVSGLLAFGLLVPTLGFFGMSNLMAFAFASVLGLALGWNVGAGLENAKRDEFSSRFIITLEDFHRMVRFGISASQALGSVTAAAVEPVRSPLRNIVLETEFGVPIGIAMDHEARRVRISELSMLAAVVSTQSRTGGNLSESVNNLATMLRERLDNRSRMKSATAESRITLVILAFVPVAGIGIQAAMQPELVDVLLTQARHLLGIGVGLIIAGLVISWLMIRSAQR